LILKLKYHWLLFIILSRRTRTSTGRVEKLSLQFTKITHTWKQASPYFITANCETLAVRYPSSGYMQRIGASIGLSQIGASILTHTTFAPPPPPPGRLHSHAYSALTLTCLKHSLHERIRVPSFVPIDPAFWPIIRNIRTSLGITSNLFFGHQSLLYPLETVARSAPPQ